MFYWFRQRKILSKSNPKGYNKKIKPDKIRPNLFQNRISLVFANKIQLNRSENFYLLKKLEIKFCFTYQ